MSQIFKKIILPFFGKDNSFWSVESRICISLTSLIANSARILNMDRILHIYKVGQIPLVPLVRVELHSLGLGVSGSPPLPPLLHSLEQGWISDMGIHGPTFVPKSGYFLLIWVKVCPQKLAFS